MTIKEKAEEYFENECEPSYADNTEQLKEDIVLAFMKGAEAALRMRMNTKTLKKLICDNEELKQKLEQAKEIIKDLLRLPYDWEVCGNVISYLDKAAQFIKELEIREDRLCEHCDKYKSCPDGKRCRTCDNGSKWKRSKEK